MITFNAVEFSYSRKKVFDDISFELKPGCVYGLLGENGTGKSTILNLIAGILKPAQGEVKVNGYKSFDKHTAMLEELYMLPEDFELPPISFRDYIDIYSIFYPKFSKLKVDDYIKRFKIDANFRLDKMSMGQRKKALISFGFATCCNFLLLDEPTNGFDIPSKSVFREIITELSEENRIIIISTHQIRDVDNLLDHVVIIDHRNMLLNASIFEISQKLLFESSITAQNPIYTEGMIAVSRNLNQQDSSVNIEVLFNALINNKEQIGCLFSK